MIPTTQFFIFHACPISLGLDEVHNQVKAIWRRKGLTIKSFVISQKELGKTKEVYCYFTFYGRAFLPINDTQVSLHFNDQVYPRINLGILKKRKIIAYCLLISDRFTASEDIIDDYFAGKFDIDIYPN